MKVMTVCLELLASKNDRNTFYEIFKELKEHYFKK